MSLLNEVAAWKLEAKLEDNARYFFHLEEVNQIESGQNCYVIGRKGTGKTAITEYLRQIATHDVFAAKLTFKNFPFNELYALDNSNYTRPNQYITLWKYMIYSYICKSMSRNERIDADVRQALEKIYSPDPIKSLSRTIARWTAKDFSVNILGVGGQFRVEQESAESSQDWSARVDILEDIILKYVDDSRYLIIFDELDEDYKDVLARAQQNQYIDLCYRLVQSSSRC